MDFLTGMVGQWSGGGEMLRWGVLLATGVTFFAVSLAVLLSLVSATDPVRRRTRQWRAAPAGEKPGGASRFSEGSLGALARYVLPASGEERSKVRRSLTVAGYRAGNAVTLFYTLKTALAFGLPLLFLLVTPLLPGITFQLLVAGVLVSSGLGMFLPNAWVQRAARQRQQRLARGMPDALDLLVVCTEAGYGLKQAIQRVGEELELIHPDLARELALANAEMRAGVERREALHNLVERNDMEELRGLVTLLVQSMRFGTSIADALRVYAEEFRDKRMQRAEEKAATIQTKMIFPLVFCIFPAFFIVTVGPPIIGVLEMFNRL